MPPARPVRHVAPAAAASVATALVAALLLAVSLVGGASAQGVQSTVSTPVAHGSTPARAHVGGAVGGKHARVGPTSSVVDHLKTQQLDLASTPPAGDVDLPRSTHGDAEDSSSLAVSLAAPRPDSRGPPAV